MPPLTTAAEKSRCKPWRGIYWWLFMASTSTPAPSGIPTLMLYFVMLDGFANRIPITSHDSCTKQVLDCEIIVDCRRAVQMDYNFDWISWASNFLNRRLYDCIEKQDATRIRRRSVVFTSCNKHKSSRELKVGMVLIDRPCHWMKNLNRNLC